MGYYSQQYCFDYKDVNGTRIHECGDKVVLQEKYKEQMENNNNGWLKKLNITKNEFQNNS